LLQTLILSSNVTEELHNLYSSPNTIRMMKSRRIGLAGYSICERKEKYIQNFGKKTWRKELDLDELEWMILVGFIWLMTGSCEEGNEFPSYIKFRDFLTSFSWRNVLQGVNYYLSSYVPWWLIKMSYNSDTVIASH
jgi:hypothetical protein